MTAQSDHPDSARPAVYGFIETALVAIGAMLFVNLDEDPETFMVLIVEFGAPGLYLLIAGAVAQGMCVARR